MGVLGTPRRALCVLSGLGVAAILAAVVLLLGIQRKVIAEQKAEERATIVEYTRQRCNLLKAVLVARVERLLARNPDATSLADIAGPIKEDTTLRALHETGHEVHVLIVDEKLRPVAAFDPKTDEGLLLCARHILEGRETVYTRPEGAEASDTTPVCLCYTCPITRDGRLLGGVVIHKDIAPLGGAFSALDRTMTWTVIVTQLVLLLALAAIAYSAHRAIAEAERHRAELERLGSLGNLAAGIAHEVRNPLNTIALTCRYIERLLEQSSQEAPLRAEVNRNFEIVASELGRLTRTLDDFLLLAKPISPPATECDLDALVDDALAPFTHEFEAANVRLVRERGRPVRILADPDRARQVFANIIRNGVQAMRDGGTLTVATEVAHGQARVAFADTGAGISPKHLHRIFEPYFSTKRSGLGLGLALSLRIVQAHGGTIDAANRPGGGAVLTVSLPTHPRETADNA